MEASAPIKAEPTINLYDLFNAFVVSVPIIFFAKAVVLLHFGAKTSNHLVAGILAAGIGVIVCIGGAFGTKILFNLFIGQFAASFFFLFHNIGF